MDWELIILMLPGLKSGITSSVNQYLERVEE
jgi:hypothetical protein